MSVTIDFYFVKNLLYSYQRLFSNSLASEVSIVKEQMVEIEIGVSVAKSKIMHIRENEWLITVYFEVMKGYSSTVALSSFHT